MEDAEPMDPTETTAQRIADLEEKIEALLAYVKTVESNLAGHFEWHEVQRRCAVAEEAAKPKGLIVKGN